MQLKAIITTVRVYLCAFSAKWVVQGSYLESNRDECTVSLIYTVHLKKPGSVSFDYQYVDNSIFFEFFVSLDSVNTVETRLFVRYFKTLKAAILYCKNQNVFGQIQNDQCQEMDQDSNKKWIKLTSHGEWGTHSVSQKRIHLYIHTHYCSNVWDQ